MKKQTKFSIKKTLVFTSILLSAMALESASNFVLFKKENAIDKSVMKDSIPNYPTWCHVEDKGYTNNFLGGTTVGPDTDLNQEDKFNPTDNEEDLLQLFPTDPTEYWDWFSDNGEDYGWLGGGGGWKTLSYEFDLYDYNSKPTGSEKDYDVQAIRINEMNIFYEEGDIDKKVFQSGDKDFFSVTSLNTTEDLANDEESNFVTTEDGNTAYQLVPSYYSSENQDAKIEWLLYHPDSSQALGYTWDGDTDKIYFYIFYASKWGISTFNHNGNYKFTTFIEMDYDEYVVRDESEYTITNDKFGDEYDKDKTQENFDNLGFNLSDSNNEYILPKYNRYSNKVRPYFTTDDTYEDLALTIISNNIVDSQDKIQTSNGQFWIDFYDENNNLINKEEHLSESKVNFKIYTEGGEGIHLENEGGRDETQLLTYNIPFINMVFIKDEIIENESGEKEWVQGHNIYDYDNENGVLGTLKESEDFTPDYTDNETNFNWSYNSITEKWELRTNVPFKLNASYDDGIVSFSWMDNNDPLNKGKISLDEEFPEIENFTHDQIRRNETNNINYSVEILTKDNPTPFKFDYIYQGESKYDGVVITPADGDEDGVVDFDKAIQKEIINVDSSNFSGVEGTPSDRIAYGYVVYEPVKIKFKQGYDDLIVLRDFNGEGFVKSWEGINGKNEIVEEGVYGFNTTDEFGNNSFTVIEYVDPNSRKDKNSILFEESNNSNNDYGVFQYQAETDEELYDSYSAAEYRYLDNLVKSDELVNIETSINDAINNELINEYFLQETTNLFELGTSFNEKVIVNDEETTIKKELEEEIYRHIDTLGMEFTSNECDIVWNGITDDTIIDNDMELSFTIVPRGKWKTKGTKTITFTPQTYVDLSKIDYDIDAISSITNNFEDGYKIDGDNVYDINGNKTNVEDEIYNEVRKEVINSGVSEEVVDDYLEVNVSNGIAGDNILNHDSVVRVTIQCAGGNYSDDSKADVKLLQGKKELSFNSETRINVNNLEFNNQSLVDVTAQYYLGTQFSKIELALKTEIKKQLIGLGLNPEDFDITFDTKDTWNLNTTDPITYHVIPNNNKYLGSTTGTFVANPFTSLDALIMNNIPLMQITNKYDSGTEFNKIEPELTQYIKDDLESRGLTMEYINIDWNVDDSAAIDYSTKLEYTITSNNETFIQGSYTGVFDAWTFYDLNSFMLDVEAINAIIEPFLSEGYVMFSDLRPLLDEEIFKELNEQGFYTSIENDSGEEIQILEIEWDRGDGERITLGQNLQFEIKSQNEFINSLVIKGDIKNSKLQFGDKVDHQSHISFGTFLEIIIILLLIGAFLLIGVIIKSRLKYKKKY